MTVRRYFTFTARHYARDLVEVFAAEMYGTPRTVMLSRGKVRAWTRWGARRYIRKLFGSYLIEIADVAPCSLTWGSK